MEHCKKLVLVPHETVSRLQEKTVARTGTNAIGELDTEMHKILLQKAEDSEKWKMYNQTLQRYLHFANEQRKPLEIQLPSGLGESGISGTKTSVSSEDNARLLTQLVTAIPKRFKHNATALFESLSSQQASTQIVWDGNGTVSIQNTPLPQTNIVELISDAARNRKTAQAVGWKEFASVLKQLNTSIDLIPNTEYKEFIRSQRGLGITSTQNASSHTKSDKRSSPGIIPIASRPAPPRRGRKPQRQTTRFGRISKHTRVSKGWAKWLS